MIARNSLIGKKVIPIRQVLDDKGTVWEDRLFNNGFNELSYDNKFGIIKGVFNLKNSNSIVFDIHWPALGMDTLNVFKDEIVIFNENKNG